jgi:hypothetical protein
VYGKIFTCMYDGTLADNWKALITFQQMIILCDDQGVLDMTPSAIARRTGIPIEYIQEGIEHLEKEDPQSRTPDEGGRRIIRLSENNSWGWKIVNHAKYRNMASYEDKKKADRERIAKKRNKNKDVAGCRNVSQEVADVAHTDTDTDTDTDTNIKEKKYPFKYKKKVPIPKNFCLTNDMRDYAKRQRYIGNNLEAWTEEMILSAKAKGYTYQDWHAAWKNWFRRYLEKNPKLVEEEKVFA